MRVLELFKGSGSIQKYCSLYPEKYEVVSLDIEDKYQADITAEHAKSSCRAARAACAPGQGVIALAASTMRRNVLTGQPASLSLLRQRGKAHAAGCLLLCSWHFRRGLDVGKQPCPSAHASGGCCWDGTAATQHHTHTT